MRKRPVLPVTTGASAGWHFCIVGFSDGKAVSTFPENALSGKNLTCPLQDSFRHVQAPLDRPLNLLAGLGLQLRIDLPRIGDELRILAHGGESTAQRFRDGRG